MYMLNHHQLSALAQDTNIYINCDHKFYEINCSILLTHLSLLSIALVPLAATSATASRLREKM